MKNISIKKLTRKYHENAVTVKISNLKEVAAVFGQRSKNEALRIIGDCISQTFDGIGKFRRISEGEFVCLSKDDIRGYVSQLEDTIGFAIADKAYTLDITIGYETP